MSGRVTGLAVASGGSRVYAGAANGGVWFSADGGITWAPLDDYFNAPSFVSGLDDDSLSVGSIAVLFGTTAATDTIFVGTGEPQTGQDQPDTDCYFGVGIKQSAAGGAPGTWTLEGTNLAGHGIFRIVIDPDDPSVVFAATTIGIYQRPASAPFTTWTPITSANFTDSSRAVSDLIVAGSGAAKVYYAAFWGDGVYSSTDVGLTWNPVAGLPAGFGRLTLAAGESDPSVVYTLLSPLSTPTTTLPYGTLCRMDSGTGGTFQIVTGVPKALFFHNQGWYDAVLAVDPANANTVYMAGDLTLDVDWTLSFYKGTITGAPGSYVFPFNPANDIFTNSSGQPDSSKVPNDPTWIGSGVHPDAHSFAFATNSPTSHDGTNVWIGSDGGLFQSTKSGAAGSFAPKNTGLAITEMTFIGQRPDTDAALFGGAQDQGNLRFRNAEEASFEGPEGDGGGVGWDPNNQYQVMRQYHNASLYTCTDGGNSGSWTDLLAAGLFPPVGSAPNASQLTARNAENSAAAFYSPIAVSPAGVAPTMAAFGTNRVWLTEDWGSTWTTLPTNTNPYANGGTNTTQDVLYTNPTTGKTNPIVAIAIAAANLIYAATALQVYSLKLALGSWSLTEITTTGLPGSAYITSIAVEDPAAGSFYVTLGGGNVDHVWYFDGTSWESAFPQATLDVPAHAIVLDPNNTNIIYVGTDVGVWQGTKAAGAWTWTVFSQGLPQSAVTDLKIHNRARLLRAATHGRGVWEIALDATTGMDPDIYFRANYADTGRIQGGTRFPWIEGAPDPTAPGYLVYHYMSADIKVRRPNLSPLPTISPQQNFLDFAVNIGDYIDPQTHMETADLPGTTDQIFIEVHNRGLTPLAGGQVQVLLLLADASAGLPLLPTGYASNITSSNTNPAWLGSNWKFADQGTPYRNLPAAVEARTPQVVRYDVDFSSLSMPSGDTHVCAAAFITTPNDPLASTNTDLDQLAMSDKHVAQRNLHLVVAPATPSRIGPFPFIEYPRTFLIDFNNVTVEEATVDLVFQRPHFSGYLSLLLPKLKLSVPYAQALKGFTLSERSGVEASIAAHMARWLGELGGAVEHVGEEIEAASASIGMEALTPDARDVRKRRIADLDFSRVYVASESPTPTISGVRLAPGGRITAAVTVRAPPNAKPGDRFRFDILQKKGSAIVGGSTYVLAVTEDPKATGGARRK